jgi:periplasmic divalent cation tolerance protein
MDGTGYVRVVTTVETEAHGRELAEKIIAERLAACVQSEPIHSVYRWKGRVERTGEYRLTAKTRAALAPDLVSFIVGHHAYETPEVIVLPILHGHPDYLSWIEQETSSRDTCQS